MAFISYSKVICLCFGVTQKRYTQTTKNGIVWLALVHDQIVRFNGKFVNQKYLDMTKVLVDYFI